MRFLKNLGYPLLLILSHNIFCVNYYVSPNGAISNNGVAANTPFRYCQQAADSLKPGDTLFLMEGIHETQYQDAPVLDIIASGTKESPIVITSYQNQEATIYFKSWEGIKISGASHIVISNIKIQGSREEVTIADAEQQTYPAVEAVGRNWTNCYNASEGEAEGIYNGQGVLIVGPNLKWSPDTVKSVPHHITIENCEIYNCTSSGIAAQQADYITVRKNRIHHNCWYTIYGTSAVNFYQMVNTDSTVTNHNIIEKNLIYNNRLYIDPVTTFCNRYDGNGIIIDDFRHVQLVNYKNTSDKFPAYSAHTTIRNNIITNNGGSGISVFKSNNVHILNNTLVKNGLYLAPALNPAEIAIGDYADIDLKNNIIYSDTAVDKSIDNNQRHTIFLYEVDGSIGNLSLAHNLLYGEENSSLPLPACTTCLDQINPEFNSLDVQHEFAFISTSNYLTKAGITDSLSSDTDYFSNSTQTSLGAIELSDLLCGIDGLVTVKNERTDYSPFEETSINYNKSFSHENNLIETLNPCREYFPDSYQLEFDKFTVFPNPVESGQTIYLSESTNFKLFDVRGVEVLSRENTYYLSTHDLSKGLYLLVSSFDKKKIIIH